MTKKITWISEQEAARMFGYKDPVWFRKLVKERKIEVDYTSVNGRKYKYSLEDLDRFLLSQSTIMKRL
jgi:hypothetical protein